MGEWKRFPFRLRADARRAAWVFSLTPLAACSLTDFDPLTAGVSAGASALAGGGGSTAGGGGTGGDGQGGAGGTDPPAPADAGPMNLIVNAGFEDGASLWAPVGMCVTTIVASAPRSGANCLLTSGRTEAWQGPGYTLLGLLEPGRRYDARIWARSEAGAYPLTLTYKQRCADDPTEGVYSQLGSRAVTTEWTELTGTLLAPDCNLLESTLYVEAAPPGESFCIDDTSVEPSP